MVERSGHERKENWEGVLSVSRKGCWGQRGVMGAETGSRHRHGGRGGTATEGRRPLWLQKEGGHRGTRELKEEVWVGAASEEGWGKSHRWNNLGLVGGWPGCNPQGRWEPGAKEARWLIGFLCLVPKELVCLMNWRGTLDQ